MKQISAILCIYLLLGQGRACFWDSDTLAMEQRQFPNLLELIVGHLPVHSQEYYEWIIQDRLTQLRTNAKNLDAMNDLAVAYDKTGNPLKGIEVMRHKEGVQPGEYTTAANLGTLCLHVGDFDNGLFWIRRAIQINPDAHFGREIIQQRLVEYLLEKRVNGKTKLPLDRETPNYPGKEGVGFAAYFLRIQSIPAVSMHNVQRQQFLDRAGRGVAGMMRFGNIDSPILLETMGDILYSSHRHDTKGARQHAAFAYLRASQLVDDDDARQILRTKAGNALAEQAIIIDRKMVSPDGQSKVPVIEKALAQLLEQSKTFRERLHNAEREWINDGKRPDEQFLSLLDDKDSFLNTQRLSLMGNFSL